LRENTKSKLGQCGNQTGLKAVGKAVDVTVQSHMPHYELSDSFSRVYIERIAAHYRLIQFIRQILMTASDNVSKLLLFLYMFQGSALAIQTNVELVD